MPIDQLPANANPTPIPHPFGEADPLDRAKGLVLAGKYADAVEPLQDALSLLSDDRLCEALVLRLILFLNDQRYDEATNIGEYIKATWGEPTIERAMIWNREPLRAISAELFRPVTALSWSQLVDGFLPGLASSPDRQPAPRLQYACAGDQPLIVVEIGGGLGNQLFQYAAALQWARRCGGEVRVELSFYQAVMREDRRFLLDHFNVKVLRATAADLERVRHRRHTQIMPSFDDGIMRGDGDAYLQGFWVGEIYFKNIAREIRECYRLRNHEIAAYAKRYVAELRRPGSDVVALHVRRGDIAAPNNRNRYKYHHPEYYRRAVLSFPKGTTILVFSDDALEIEWCKEMLNISSDYRVVYSELHSALFDFSLMQACDHLIISISTFSWWAAWLNPNPDKIVITPSGFQAAGALHAASRWTDWAPPGWTTLTLPPEYVLWWT